jgi:Flp pilus assembly protein TadG
MMLHSMHASRRRNRRAAVVVETAVIAILVLFIAFAFIEISRAVMVEAVLTNAARAGARAGSLSVGNYGDILNAVGQVVQDSHGIAMRDQNGNVQTPSAWAQDHTQVSINMTNCKLAEPSCTSIPVPGSAQFDSTVQRGVEIQVRVSVPYSEVAWLPGTFWLAPGLVLSGTAVVNREP